MQSLVCEVLFTQLLHQGILIRRLNHGLAQLLPHVLLQNLFPLGIVHRIKFGFTFLDGCVKGRINIARGVVGVILVSQDTSFLTCVILIVAILSCIQALDRVSLIQHSRKLVVC